VKKKVISEKKKKKIGARKLNLILLIYLIKKLINNRIYNCG